MSDPNLLIDREDCVVGWENFKHLSDSERRLLSDNRYEATFKAGEIMLKQGSPASNALFLSSGLAKTFIEGHNGRNFMLSIALPGHLIIGPGAYVNSRHSYSVAAITTVKACFISFNIIREFARANGEFADGLLSDISAKALRLHYRVVNLTQKKMPGRLADALLYFSDEVFKSDEYEMILSRQELGEMANMAKECVVRLLKDLEDSGVIYSKSSKIKILDKSKLIQISEKG